MTDLVLVFLWLAWPLSMFLLSLWVTERRIAAIERFMCDDCFFRYKDRERLDALNDDGFGFWRGR